MERAGAVANAAFKVFFVEKSNFKMYTNFHCYTKVKWHDLNKTPNGNQTAFHAEAAGSTAATEDPKTKGKDPQQRLQQ